MSDYENRLTKVEQKVEHQGESLEKIEKKLDDITKLLSTRPTWINAAYITALTSVTTGLIVYVSSH